MYNKTRTIIGPNQILQYTEVGEEYEDIKTVFDMAEKLLDHINETIRDQEGIETLKKISQHLWVGEGYVHRFSKVYLAANERIILVVFFSGDLI